VHSLFSQSRWTDLAALVKQELSPHSRDGEIRTRIDEPAVLWQTGEPNASSSNI
jgi:hypothetical protein